MKEELEQRVSRAIEVAFFEMTGRELKGKSCSPMFRRAVKAACVSFSPADFVGVDHDEMAMEETE